MPKAAVDTNVLIAMVDGRDNWHTRTENFIERIELDQNMKLVYFDCVLNETLSVLGRRLEEQKRPNEFIGLAESVQKLIPKTVCPALKQWIPGKNQKIFIFDFSRNDSFLRFANVKELLVRYLI
jgi:predicted nucleic acid-binding protein